MSIEGTGMFEGIEGEAPIKPNLLALDYPTTEADGDNTFKKTTNVLTAGFLWECRFISAINLQ
jgi:hypothetical protein